jgi:hypothetical protein
LPTTIEVIGGSFCSSQRRMIRWSTDASGRPPGPSLMPVASAISP